MNDDEEFLLKWNNHQTNLIGIFSDWLGSEKFIDVTLVCGKTAIPCHKVVLAACSPLLERILNDNPCHHPILILNEINQKDINALIQFIYHGEVSVSNSELASFLKTADNLQIKGLAEETERSDKRKEKDSSPMPMKKVKSTPPQISENFEPLLDNDSDTSSTNKKQKSSISPFLEHNLPAVTLNGHHNEQENIMYIEQNFELESQGLEENINMLVKQEPKDMGDDWKVFDKSPDKLCEKSLNISENVQIELQTQPVQFMQNLSSNVDFTFNSSSPIDCSLLDEQRDENTAILLGADITRISFIPKLDELTEEDSSNLTQSKMRGARKTCCYCRKTFCDNYTLRRHIATHMPRERQFECELCSSSYSRKDHLMAHVRRKHSSDYTLSKDVNHSCLEST